MVDDVCLEAMRDDFILWRCLHGGPLDPQSIDRLPADGRLPWEAYRARNLPLLQKIIRTYGSCAILARDGARVVGFLRFYPKALLEVEGAGHLCLQQDYPAGPSELMVEQSFPPLEQIVDRTLQVHCLMTGSPSQEHNPYQRQGLGTRMVGELMRWAREWGWRAIEATAYEDLPILYAITGQAGKTFWEKLGFRLVGTEIEPGFDLETGLLRTMLAEAAARGVDESRVRNAYTMRLDLG